MKYFRILKLFKEGDAQDLSETDNIDRLTFPIDVIDFRLNSVV